VSPSWESWCFLRFRNLTGRIWFAPIAAGPGKALVEILPRPSVACNNKIAQVSRSHRRDGPDGAVENDHAHPRRPLVRQDTAKTNNAAAVGCSDWFCGAFAGNVLRQPLVSRHRQ
jgi:hypothetical protein